MLTFNGSTKCWSCVLPLSESTAVELADDVRIPVCLHCWGDMPREARIQLAQKFMDVLLHKEQRQAAVDALQILETLVREMIDNLQTYRDRHPGHD